MIKIILFFLLMQTVTVSADVIHRVRFCAGKFCATPSSLNLAQQLELNQQFSEGNLVRLSTSDNQMIDYSSKENTDIYLQRTNRAKKAY